jgi:hypothetical protein
VVVRKVWPSLDVAVTWPLLAGAMVIVFMEVGLFCRGIGACVRLRPWIYHRGVVYRSLFS